MRPSGSLVVPVWFCREPEQLPGPHCEPASCKVGRGQAMCGGGGLMAAEIFIGIDVARDSLEVAVRPSGEHWSVSNQTAGLAELLVRVRAVQPTLIVLEATGGLELPALGVLGSAGLPVVAVNPRQVRDFAKATGKLAKTDAIDAQVLAHFADAVRPAVRPLPDAATQALSALVARRRQLVEMLSAEENRHKTAPT